MPTSPWTGAAAALRCTVDVRATTVDCRPDGSAPGGISAAIIGGQGVNVRLASSGTVLDGEVLSTRVTVENLMSQVLGTADDLSPAPEGVRVFFASGPEVIQGSGAVSVTNADSAATFTAAGQKYFQYAGLLAPGDTSEAREWRFSVPATATQFVFTVYVAARVRQEAGWVSLAPVGPSLAVGDTQRITPVVRAVTGQALAGQPVAWASSNLAVATVDSLGLVTAVGAGTALVTATSGGRSGRVTVVVSAPGGGVPPTVVRIETPASVTANGVDSLWVRVTARAGGAGVRGGMVTFRSVAGRSAAACVKLTLESGTVNDGVFRCAVVLGNGSRAGLWRVEGVTVTGDGDRTVTGAALQAAGWPGRFHVDSPNPDVTAPVLTGVSFKPDTTVAGEDTLRIRVTATDAGAGASSILAWFQSPSGRQSIVCSRQAADSVTAGTFVFVCPGQAIPVYVEGGQWLLYFVQVRDAVGNITRMETAALRAAGFPTALMVTSTNPDNTPPVITGFTLAPDTVVGNGTDSLVISVTASDAYSGFSTTFIHFRNLTTGQTRLSGFGTLRPPGEATIISIHDFVAPEAGSWQIDLIEASDRAGNSAYLTRAQMEARHYPTTFVVTPP
ncbi:MAG TPA: Ig-like domain-containing protein [Longimicrobium sp.]|nr:Ig-like domain-containing protein [Longimicrobium sp.]